MKGHDRNTQVKRYYKARTIKMRHRKVCPQFPKKICHATEEVARQALLGFLIAHGDLKSMEVYACPDCDSWHLGRKRLWGRKDMVK